MKKITQEMVQLLAVVCMVVLTAFSAKADEIVLDWENLGIAGSYSSDAKTINDVDFLYNSLYRGGSASAGYYIQMNSTKPSLLWNTTPIVGIQKIVIELTSSTGTLFTVSQSSSVCDSTDAGTAIEAEQDGTTCTYTFDGVSTYFSIQSPGGATTAYSITITYFESSDPTAIPSSSEVAFTAKYTETDTQKVGLSGANLTSDATVSIEGEGFSTETTTLTAAKIMAGADIEVVFTAPEAAGEYNGTLYIASDDFDTIEVALVGTSLGVTVDYKLVTDIADLTSGKYVITGTTDNAMTSTYTSSSTSYFGYQAVAVSNNSIYSPENNIIWDVVVTDGIITIQSADSEVYIGHNTTSSNGIYEYSSLNGDETNWTATMTSEVVTLLNVYGERYLKFNSNRFTCYTSSTGTNLRFFKKEDATEPTISVNEELAMGKVVMGETTTATLAISGELLTSDVTVSIAGHEAFTATTTTYSAEEVMAGIDFEVTFTAPEVIGDYTATITIESVEIGDVDVAVSASAIAPLTIADIFTMSTNETGSVATATVDYVYSKGAYISDADGTSILAYGLSSVEVGDVLTDIAFTVGNYGGINQLASVSYESLEAGESTISPIEVTLAALMGTDGLSLYGGQLVTVKEVDFSSTTFATSNTITQDETESLLYNSFSITVENSLPSTANVTGYVTAYNSVPQIAPREESDIVAVITDGVAQAATATTAVAGGNGAIVVKAATATTVTIYTVAGTQVANIALAQGNNTIALTQGIYLVVVDGTVAKAVVR